MSGSLPPCLDELAMRRRGTGTTSTDHNLARRATIAVSWSFLNTAVGRLGTLAIGIVVARLLGPHEFGVFAVAMLMMLAVLSFNELGVSLAIVRWENDPREVAPTVNTVATASSALLTIALWVSAPSICALLGAPEAVSVVRWLSLAVLINGLVSTPAAAMQRELMQRERMVIDQVNVWLGAGVSILLAALGFGAMSLAVGRLAGSLVAAGMFLRVSPIPFRFGLNRKIARRLFRFGLPLAGTSVIVFVIGYTDQLVAGGLLGPTELGFYVLAFNLASWPVSIFSQPLRSVTPAVFARLQRDPARMGEAFRSIVRLTLCVAAPVCLVMAAVASPLVDLVYGEVWAPSAPILAWLAGFALVRIIAELGYDFLVIAAPTTRLLLIQAIWAVALIPALVVSGGQGGLVGIAMAQVLVGVLIVLPLYVWFLSHSGVKSISLMRDAALPLGGAAIATLPAPLMVNSVGSGLLLLGATGVIGVVAVGVCVAFSRDQVRAFRNVEDISVQSTESAGATS